MMPCQRRLPSLLLASALALPLLPATLAAAPEQRLAPAAILALPHQAAGAGTSGVAGIETRVLAGDPNGPGLYTIQLLIPAKTRIESHRHQDERVATVVSGTWHLGYGEKFDEKALAALPPGSFYTEPADRAHFARTGNEPVVLQITGSGPTDTRYAAAAAPAAKLPAGLESRHAKIDGVGLHYLIAGSGPPVVLLHGYAETSHMWLPLIAELAKDHQVIAPDLRGAGDSEKPAGGYDKKTMARDVHALVQSLGLRRVAVVGHDIGLMVAYAYAAQFPAEVERIVLMDAFLPGIGEWQNVWLLRDLWHFHFYGEVPLQLVAGRERTYFEHFWNDFAADKNHSVPEADRQFYAAAYAQPGGMRAGFEYFRAFERDAADFAELAKKKLPMPMLVLTGEKASGTFLIEQARLVAAEVRGVVVPGSGHWLMEEAPAVVIPALVAFLGDRQPGEMPGERQAAKP